MSAGEMTIGSLTGLMEGGVVSREIMEDAETGKRVLCFKAETPGGTEVELVLHEDEAVEVGTDFLRFAQDCRSHNVRFEADASDYEYEPNREALAVEARVEPEGRWGDE